MVETENFQKELEEVRKAGVMYYNLTMKFNGLFANSGIIEEIDELIEKSITDPSNDQQRIDLLQAFKQGFNQHKQ